MVAWHMIVRMTIRMVPDDRNIQKSERSVIAPPYRLIPRTIIRSQIQAIFLDIVFQPIAKHRMRFRIEINDMHRLGLVFITANHVVIQIPLHLIHLQECLHEIFGA